MQGQQSQDHSPPPPHPASRPLLDQRSEHTLSNDLRELAEDQAKTALLTENPQKTLEDASRVEKDSANNTLLANSELIQMPIQQFVQQQQAPLRLSTPVAPNRQPNFIQTAGHGQQPIGPLYNQNLRASLPANGPNQIINQGLTQNFSGWINQPATTQARVQTNVREFPVQGQVVQGQPGQGQARVPVNMQQIGSQIRPSSASPQRITFNYQPSQKNIPPPSQPAILPPQPNTQPVILPPQPNIYPVHPPQPVIVHPVHPSPIPPRPVDPNSAVFILPQPQQQAVVWQQRYFIILQKFQYYYTRIEVIHSKCVYLDQAIVQTKKTEELQLLRAQSEQLLHLITSTEQELSDTIHRNRQLLTESSSWKQKYEQLARAFEVLRQSQAANTQELTNRVQLLNRQLAELEANYHQAAKKNEDEVAKNHRLENEVQALNGQVKELREKPAVPANYQEFQLQYKEMGKIIEEKNLIIANLKKALDEKAHSGTHPVSPSGSHPVSPSGSHPVSPAAAEVLEREIKRLEEEILSRDSVIGRLQGENSQLRSTHETEGKEYRQTVQRYKQQILQQQTIITVHQGDVRKYQAIIESKTAEINNFSKQSSSSQGTPRNSETEMQNRRLKHELAIYEQSHASDLKILNGKLQEQLDKIKMISNERDSTVGNLQEKATLLESDINRKDGTIRNLRDRILELEEEKRIRDLDRKYEPKKTEDYSQNQQLNSLRRELSDKVNEIEQLQAQLTEYKRITNEYEDSLRVKKHEVNTLKRELEERADGVQTSSQLNDQLAKKNAELADLRSKLVELEKTINQNEVLRQENIQLNESLRKKHSELSEAADKAYFLEKRVRELEGTSDKSPKVVQLAQEVELLEAAIAKKEQEVAKLRQGSQLLQSNIDELEIELERVRSRLSAGEKSSESERSELKGRLSVVELRAVEYERKMAGLEEVRAIMGEQINTLTAEIHIKYENQQRLELEIKQERGRTKALQSEIEAQLAQTEEMRGKVREWERKYQNLNKELQTEFEKKKDLSNTKKNELFNLNNKYVQLQNTLKAKDGRIKELERSVDSLNGKIRGMDHNLEEIEYLKHKISEYEHKISYQSHRFVSRLPDLEPTQVFERKVIYQLKVENEALRRQLGLAPKPEGKEANIPERDTNNTNVHQRLSDFHKKLEEVISENLVVDYSLTGDELFRRMERDRRLLIEKHNEEITQLKVRILELEGHGGTLPKRYSNINQIFNEQLDFYREKNLQLQQRVESHIKVNRELKESIEVLLKAQSGEASISYYREQLQKANDTIVNLQKQLKKLNEEGRKLKQDASRMPSKQLVESNVVESESKAVELTRKISQLTLEISLLEKERVSKDETISKSDAQLRRLKLVIEELKSSKDQLQRTLKERENAYQDEITKVTNKLRINQMQIERLNGIVSTKHDQDSSDLKSLRGRIAQLQEENKKLRTRVEELIISEEKYQREIAKQENRTQVLMGEMQRLKEIGDGVGKRQREGDVELQSLRVAVSEYEGKFKAFESQRESFSYRETQFQQEINRLANQTKLLQAEIERMSEFTQKKVAEKDAEIGRLKVLLGEKQDHNSRLEDQIREMKVLSFKSSETAQEIFALKEEINNLKVSQSLRITESENRLKEIYQLNDRLVFSEEQSLQVKRSFEAKIIQLQGIINTLQGQLSETRKIRDSSSIETSNRVQYLEDQLRILKTQKEQEISVYKTKISVFEGQTQQLRASYERQLTELRSANFSLHENVGELTYLNTNLSEQQRKLSAEYERLILEFHSNEQIIVQLRLQISQLQEQVAFLSSSQSQAGSGSGEVQRASRYSIEYLRSILVEVDVLLSEEGSVRFDILQRVEKEVDEGLEECRRWNEKFVI